MNSAAQPFTMVDKHGKVLFFGVSETPPNTPDAVALVGQLPPDEHYWDRETEAWVEIPPSPSPNCTFDWQTKTWVDPRTLEQAKEQKRQEINRLSAAAMRAQFEFGGKVVDCDSISRSYIDAINGEVNASGQMPPNWTGAWKTTDNSWLPIPDVSTWRAFYSAMVNKGLENFAHAQRLKADLEAASTVEQVDSISW